MISEDISSILARQEANQQASAGGAQNIVDKDGFLKLLMAQMQHQDPFEPMDNSEMLSQMAQFSSLEQMQNINGSLTSSLQWDLLFNQTINNTMATSLIGREVEALGNTISLGTDGDVGVRYELGAFARDTTIEVLDTSGNVVYSERKAAQDSGIYDWDWDGRDYAGTRMPAGDYAVRVTATDVDGGPVSTQSYRLGIVEGVEYEQGQAFLIVNGQRISLGEVQRISQAG